LCRWPAPSPAGRDPATPADCPRGDDRPEHRRSVRQGTDEAQRAGPSHRGTGRCLHGYCHADRGDDICPNPHTGLLFRLVAGAYERRSLAIGSHWPFEQWGRFLPEQTTAVSILDRLLHHATVVITDGDSYRMKDAQHRKGNPPPT